MERSEGVGFKMLTRPLTGNWLVRVNRPILSAIRIEMKIQRRIEDQRKPNAMMLKERGCM